MTRTRIVPRTPDRAGAARPAAGGFTLVELLVVIGIVVLLVAILLPTAGKMRVQAQTAGSRSRVASISAAIERYHQDYKVYPGTVSNAQITAGFKPAGVQGGNLSMTENMVLSLCGGFVYNPANTVDPVEVNVADIGKGPLALTASVVKRVRHAPYIDPTVGRLFAAAYNPADPESGMVNGPNNPLEMPGIPRIKQGGPPSLDSNVPEFVDEYSQPRVIVYLRATVGGRSIQDVAPGNWPAEEYTSDALQYNLLHLTIPYRRAPVTDAEDKMEKGIFKGDFVFSKDEHDPAELEHTHEYMKHPRIANAPRGKDKFLLISAGPDRRYGTRDDIVTGD